MTHKPRFLTMLGLITLITLTGFKGYATVNTSMKMTSPQTLADNEADKGTRLIDIDGYNIELKSLFPGQTMSSIMLSQGFDNKTVHKVSQKAKNIFKINELSSGLTYIVARQTRAPLEKDMELKQSIFFNEWHSLIPESNSIK